MATALKRPLIESVYPFSLEETIRFVRDVAAATGQQERAEAFISDERSRVIEAVWWTLQDVFLDKNLFYYGDPNLFRGRAVFRAKAAGSGRSRAQGPAPRSLRHIEHNYQGADSRAELKVEQLYHPDTESKSVDHPP